MLSLKEVVARLGVSRSTLDRLERSGQFPARVRLSPGRVAWDSVAIESFLLERTHASRRVWCSENGASAYPDDDLQIYQKKIRDICFICVTH